MKVLVLGATGFIGLPVAQAFSRAGHEVYGLTRSAQKARQLAAEEITPIVAEPEDTSAWAPLIAKLDVVIDAVGGMEVHVIGPALLKATADAVKEYRPAHAAKLTYIYTSGSWVHGDDRKEIVSDTTPTTKPVELTSWRVDYEQSVIRHPTLNGSVIRAAMVYGKSGSFTGMMFKMAYDGDIKWYGTPGGRMACIHCDDLAAAYVLVAEKAAITKGQIFDAANDFTEGTDDILQKLVEISGAKGYEYVQSSNLFEAALSTTLLIRPYALRASVGWTPRKAGLVDYLNIYYSAWKASEELE